MSARRSAPPTAAPLTSHQRRLVALVAVAAWSILPPYVGKLVGLELDVSSKLEIVDHVIAGVVALAGAAFALLFARRGETDSMRALTALAVCALAALFQTVTHVSLVVEAGEPQAPVATVALHASPGPVMLGLALLLLLRPVPEDG